MVLDQVVKKITSLIGSVSDKKSHDIASLFGMNLEYAPTNPAGGYQWYAYSWQPYLSEVNMLEEEEGLTRIELIVGRADELETSFIAAWKSALEHELNAPEFQGAYDDAGFPEDEEGLEAYVWQVAKVQCVLLNRKEDSDTPQELVVVIKP